VDVFDLGCHRYRDLGRGVWRFWSLLRQLRPDLVHTHLWAADVVGRVAGRLAGVPVISSVHNMQYDPEARADEGGWLRLKRDAALFMDRWTAHLGARRLVAVSEYVRRSAARLLRFPAERIDLVYNPIDFEELRPGLVCDRSRIWAEAGIPAESLILLNVGRVSYQKGLIFAVRALRDILVQFPQVHLVSVGSLADRSCVQGLQAEAQSLGIGDHFHLLGPRRDIASLLRACDIFVFPSLFEGMGIALIEAMAMGCACIVSGVGPLPELVEDGKDGLLVPPRDSERFAEAVCSLLSDPAWRKSLANSAAAANFQKFQPTESTSRLTAIYRSVV
jgi:glycosyltransferase involved in cell wall biosynthesis